MPVLNESANGIVVRIRLKPDCAQGQLTSLQDVLGRGGCWEEEEEQSQTETDTDASMSEAESEKEKDNAETESAEEADTEDWIIIKNKKLI